MATKYLSQSDLTTLESRVAAVFLKKADFNTMIANYSTTDQVTSAITTAIAGVTQFDYQVVNALPDTGTKGVIYLIANEGEGNNIYDEYIWIVVNEVGRFELFGTKELELVEYKGSATVTVEDGTGADAGKKIIKVKYGSEFQETDNGLELSDTVKTSLGKANSALQGVTSTGSTVTITGDGDTKNLEVSSTIVNGAAAGATAVQPDDDNSIGAAVINALWTE